MPSGGVFAHDELVVRPIRTERTAIAWLNLALVVHMSSEVFPVVVAFAAARAYVAIAARFSVECLSLSLFSRLSSEARLFEVTYRW